MRHGFRTMLSGIGVIALTAAHPVPQTGEPPASDRRKSSASFQLSDEARESLRELWRLSVASNTERVACLAGHYEAGSYHISRVGLLSGDRADSLHAAPGPSLELCGPPRWWGTAHTHIVPYRGRPFRTFSVNDRVVLSEWRHRWRTEGVFCVLFTAERAYCEFGTRLNGMVVYASDPGSERCRVTEPPERRRFGADERPDDCPERR